MTVRVEVDVALAAQATLGESPVWDDRTGTLVFVDISEGEVHRFDPSSGSVSTVAVDGQVGAAVLDADGGLVVARDRSLLRCASDGSDVRPFGTFEAPGEVRWNDGAVDPWGRFVIGTMDLQYTRPIGALYRVEHDGTVTEQVDGVIISNGLDWAADATHMYYVDSGTRRVDVFDVGADGELGDRRTIVSFDDGLPGGPDGLTLDAEGCIWVACWSRSCVRRYTPDGRLDAQIDLPVRAVTSVAFGGDDLGDLYITTGTYAEGGGGEPEPHAGDVFVARPGVTGVPPHRFGRPRLD